MYLTQPQLVREKWLRTLSRLAAEPLGRQWLVHKSSASGTSQWKRFAKKAAILQHFGVLAYAVVLFTKITKCSSMLGARTGSCRLAVEIRAFCGTLFYLFLKERKLAPPTANITCQIRYCFRCVHAEQVCRHNATYRPLCGVRRYVVLYPRDAFRCCGAAAPQDPIRCRQDRQQTFPAVYASFCWYTLKR